MTDGIHVGDIGAEIVFDTGESLAAATVHTLRYQKPDGTQGTWPGTVDGNTVKYTTTLATDIDIAGQWLIQAYLDIGTWKGHTDWDKFTVYPNLE